jgi:GNAT superfamily N-acetyltransferase
MQIVVRDSASRDAAWIEELLVARWAGPRIVVRGIVHDATRLPALVAERAGERCGLATYRVAGAVCELVSLDACEQHARIGTMLVEALVRKGRDAGCRRLSVVTTNDNLDALRFYQRRGFVLVAVHPGAVDAARRLKPGIPATGTHGIAIRDEIELERPL